VHLLETSSLVLTLLFSCCAIVPVLIVVSFVLRGWMVYSEGLYQKHLETWAEANQLRVTQQKTLPFRAFVPGRILRGWLWGWDVTVVDRDGHPRRGRVLAWPQATWLRWPFAPQGLARNLGVSS
jgi:hypothetical protein